MSAEVLVDKDGHMEIFDPSLPEMFEVGDRVRLAIGGELTDYWWEITPTGMKSVDNFWKIKK